MRIAVLTATRDRLAYTKHCFKTLHDNAGCVYDHFVLDNGSADGTPEWLIGDYQPSVPVIIETENVGINRAMNELVDHALETHAGIEPYDVICKVDNDCELLTPRTLRDVSRLALAHDMILSPRIHGLNNPPATSYTAEVGCNKIDLTAVIGGVFMAVPASVFTDRGYRHDEANPLWGGDDTGLCSWFRGQGGQVGYVQGYDANHYLTTEGQWGDLPWYFSRTRDEGKVAL